MRVNAPSKRTNSFFRISLTIFTALVLLLQFPAHAYAGEPTRLLPVHITVLIDRDEWKQNETNKKQKTEEIITFIAEIFEKEFGLIFVLDTIKPFDFSVKNDEINLDTNLEKIRQAADADYNESDIVLGFTAKKQFRCVATNNEGNIILNNGEKIILKKTPCPEKNKIYYGGFADQPGETAISNFNKFIALHEIGHLFGANHVSDSRSVMNATVINNAAFDAQNKEIIKQTIKEKFSMQNSP